WVVDSALAAAAEPVVAVGAGAQREHALAERNVDLAGTRRHERRHAAAPKRLPAGKPAGDTPKARPPERPRLGIVFERREMLGADVDERGGRIGGAGRRAGLGGNGGGARGGRARDRRRPRT